MATYAMIEDVINNGDGAAIRSLLADMEQTDKDQVDAIRADGPMATSGDHDKVQRLSDAWNISARSRRYAQVDVPRLIRLRDLAHEHGEKLRMDLIENALDGAWNATNERYWLRKTETK